MLFPFYTPSPPLSDFIENFWLYAGYESPFLPSPWSFALASLLKSRAADANHLDDFAR